MRDLQTIIRDNERAAAKAVRVEDNHNRECSFNGDVESGIVIHSARQRSTRFISAGAPAKKFLAGWYGRNSQESRNRLVESYF